MKYIYLLLTLCFLTFANSSLFAESTYDTGKTVPSGYNKNARPTTPEQFGFYLGGSFTYWQPYERGMDLGIVRYPDPTPVFPNEYDLLDVKSEFKPGFKVLIGCYPTDYDWDVSFGYTWYRMNKSLFFNNADKIIDKLAWEPSESLGQDALAGSKGKWKLRMDMFDFLVGRIYSIGEKLTFKTHIGLKGGIIDQRFNAIYIMDNVAHAPPYITVTSYNKSDSWIVGPKIGLDTYWHLTEDFHIFLNAALNVCYQKYDLKHLYRQDDTYAYDFDYIKKDYKFVNPSIEAIIGLRYASHFGCNDWFHFDLGAGYEIQNYWNQNELRAYVSRLVDDGSYASPSDLVLHGLTINCSLGF